MTSNMSKSQKMIVEGDCSCSVDRISSLPENVIECIMNFMSVRDAAKTCVLSTRWRYVWAHHPSLVLDLRFWEDIVVSSNEPEIDFPNIVKEIKQHHVGYIRTFVFVFSSVLNSMPRTDIDSWVSSLCSGGLKELTLLNYGTIPYRVPCSVFSSSDLIKLNLSFCVIKSGCFTNIKILYLHTITFHSSVVLTTPLLTILRLVLCRGILHFDISAPRLEALLLHENDDLNLKPFLTCTGIKYASLLYRKEGTYFEGCERFCLVKLLAAWPRITKFVVDGFYIKYMDRGSIPSKLGQLDLRSFTICDLKLDSELMPWILCILKNSPLLHTFEIWFDVSESDLNGTPDVDESRSILDLRMDQLHTVKMGEFTAAPNQVMFAKNLLHCAPVLKELFVEEDDNLDAEERARILKNLLSLQHAFPKARIVYAPYDPLHP